MLWTYGRCLSVVIEVGYSGFETPHNHGDGHSNNKHVFNSTHRLAFTFLKMSGCHVGNVMKPNHTFLFCTLYYKLVLLLRLDYLQLFMLETKNQT